MSGAISVTDLVAGAMDGRQDAWDALVARYENLVWSVPRAHRLGSADAADVVQTTWLRLLEHLASIRDPERLAGWLVTTARRESLRILRKAGREVPDDALVDVVDEAAAALDVTLLEHERDAILWACVRRLPEHCQRLLRVLMAADSPAYAEVSSALGIPIGSIGPTRGRCLDKLRALVANEGLTLSMAT